MTKISTVKSSRIKVGAHNHYRLEPAASRTHYGEHRLHSGGIPYAYPTKKADGAWFVTSDWSGDRLGVLEQGNDDWTFMKITTHAQAPRWLVPSAQGMIGTTIYNLRSSMQSGATPQEAIARGLGITLVAKTKAELDADIAEALTGRR